MIKKMSARVAQELWFVAFEIVLVQLYGIELIYETLLIDQCLSSFSLTQLKWELLMCQKYRL